ncbi:MAG: nitroreductase family protein [Chloroflexota bacterium]
MDYDLASVDYILQTTRSVRKRLDLTRPVERDVVMACMEIALQAPSASNTQRWRWVIVTDPDKKAQIGAYYQKSYANYTAPEAKLADSASHLAAHMGEVPMMIFGCVEGRPQPNQNAAGLYGSIIPAAWSLMLALRARGIGAAWTTLHLAYEKECNAVLGIPDDVTTAVLLPVAYFTGETFKIAKRTPAAEVTYWDAWGVTMDV